MAKFVLARSTFLASPLLSFFKKDDVPNPSNIPQMKRELPTRKMTIDALHRTEYDILIIGGGAVGAGCALDGVTRGLKVALVEADDFGSGSSSKSSKLLHGGLRDLNTAITRLDLAAYRRVRLALIERKHIAEMAPHLSQSVPILIPVYHWWQVPILWLKLQVYHRIGPQVVKPFYYISGEETKQLFPMINRSKILGSFLYHEGQHDDARMCLSIALTASRFGADVCNHMRVVDLIRNNKNMVVGAKVIDTTTGKMHKIRSKIVVNATGPYSDIVRNMDDPQAVPVCSPSWSSHIVLPGYYCPEEVGLFDLYKNVFFLPWQGHTLMGRTGKDIPEDSPEFGQTTEIEVQYLLDFIKNYVNRNFEVRRCDVLASWGGLKPLPLDAKHTPLQNHIINLSVGNMISVVGGTWTSFRLISERVVNSAIKYGKLEPLRLNPVTQNCKLDGASGWSPYMYIRLVQDFGVEQDVAKHLSNTYGSNAFNVIQSCSNSNCKTWPIVGKRLHTEFPYIEAEVRQGIKEYACTLVDMLARRLRVAFLNVQVAHEILPHVANLMAKELKWSNDQKRYQIQEAKTFLIEQMGTSNANIMSESIPIKMSVRQVQKYAKHFKELDEDNTGFVSVNKCCQCMKELGVKEVPVDLMHNVLRDIDVSSQGKVNLYEFLMLMSAIVHGDTAYLRYAKMHLEQKISLVNNQNRKFASVETSSGGL